MLTVIMIFLGIAVLLLFDGVLENYFPTTKEYSIQSPKIKEEKKVVLLTDLHACCVGGKKDKYLQMIQKQNPDILLLAGDMTVKNGKRTDCVIEFLKGIRSIAPVYYAPGNHEIRMPEYESFIRAVQNLGIHYLSNATEKLKMNRSDGNLPKSREIPVFTDPDRERNLQETNSVERFPYFRRSILFCFVIYFVVT